MPSARVLIPTCTRPRPRAVLALLALCLAAALGAPGVPAAQAQPGARPAYLDPTEWAVVLNVNWVRARFGLRPLRPDRGLTRAAEEHSRDMARRFYYAHDSLRGRPWYLRVRRFVRAQTVGETLDFIVGRRSLRREPKSVVRAWMRSPGHRAIVLSPAMRRIGVARASTRRRGRPAFYTADYASG